MLVDGPDGNIEVFVEGHENPQGIALIAHPHPLFGGTADNKVVTTLARSVPALEHNLHRYGMAARCARVRSSEVAVLELEHAGSDACNRISAEIDRAMTEDRAEAIVLGCAGMADLAGRLATQHGLPVLDGVSCAVKLAEAMVSLGLRTSRLGGYAAPSRL